MDELESLVIRFFEKDKKYHSKEDLRKELKVKGETKVKLLYDVIDKLTLEGYLFYDKKGYRIFTNDLGYAFGILKINKAGNGFIETRDGYKIFIRNENLNGALNGDNVIIGNIEFATKNEFKGKVYKILKRKTGNVVFEISKKGKKNLLIPYNRHENIKVTINRNDLNNLIDGDIILVQIGTECTNGTYQALNVKRIGHKTDPKIDIKLLATEYEIPIEFSKEAMEEAYKIKKEVDETDLVSRVDLRDKDIITIDCDDTKDKDDSIYIEKLKNGNFKLLTSISDVSYYIKIGTKLFEEILKRKTSRYPLNSCIPMIPHIISNGICSLNENVDRLTKTVEMEISTEGKVIETRIYKSVINSRKSMKYSEVNKVLDGEILNGYEPFVDQLKLFEEFSDLCDRVRLKRGCIDFDIPDIKAVHNEKDNPIGFYSDAIGKAQRIIENAMIITNLSIAQYYNFIPFIYRVHEQPDDITIKDTINLLRKSGIEMPKINNINVWTIKNILDSVRKSEIADIVNEELLKSMKKAKYSTLNIGHFALQLNDYCHFTSPIRRSADFIIHTIIDEVLLNNFDSKRVNELEENLRMLSEDMSKAEIIDKEFEREALMLDMAAYMENHIGEEFEAYVYKVYKTGMLVKTKNSIIGKIKLEDMDNDNFYFDYNNQALIGKNTKKRYQIGSKVYAIAKDASRANRTVSFKIEKQKSLRLS